MKTENFGIILRYSTYTTAVLVGYFLLMELLGLSQVFELRFLNFLIVGYGLFKCQEKIVKSGSGLLTGFTSGLITTALMIAQFSVLILVYLVFVDNAFIETLQSSSSLIQGLTTTEILMLVGFEGFGSGVIVSFINMVYLRQYTPKIVGQKAV